MLGSEEYRLVPHGATRVNKAYELIANSQLTVAKNAGHNLTACPSYLETLRRFV